MSILSSQIVVVFNIEEDICTTTTLNLVHFDVYSYYADMKMCIVRKTINKISRGIPDSEN